eukprot:3378136-Rhodomonas_salina.1
MRSLALSDSVRRAVQNPISGGSIRRLLFLRESMDSLVSLLTAAGTVRMRLSPASSFSSVSSAQITSGMSRSMLCDTLMRTTFSNPSRFGSVCRLLYEHSRSRMLCTSSSPAGSIADSIVTSFPDSVLPIGLLARSSSASYSWSSVPIASVPCVDGREGPWSEGWSEER